VQQHINELWDIPCGQQGYFNVPPPMKLAHVHKQKKYLDNYRRLGSLVQQLKSQCNSTTVTEGQL